MVLRKLSEWWHRLPQKTRVNLIATLLLVFAGTEVLVLAPAILDIAAMIDVFGMAMIVAAIRSSISVSLSQIRDGFATFAKPLIAAFRAADRTADFGLALFPRWPRQYLVIDALGTTAAAMLLAVFTAVMAASTAVAAG
jgi:hypothetical protein